MVHIKLLLLLLIPCLIFGQGKKDLDSKFGIKNFKLESSYSHYKNNLKYFDTDKNGVEYYVYTGKDQKELFGISIVQIGLGFYENKLYTVSINFDVLDKKQNLNLLENLKILYDIPEIFQPNNTERVWVAVWETGKTYLQATEYSCSSQINSCKTELFIYSKALKQKMSKN